MHHPAHGTATETVKAIARGGIGSIVLNRPAALNALDLGMIGSMASALEQWRTDDAVRAVVIRSSSPKAFCSGGDIRAVRAAAVRGDHEAVRALFAAEYAMDAAIAAYPKPYVALIDGFALGGGLGISVHGTARVVTERATLAMPETGIGFFPDIGAAYFLPRLPGAVGWYLALAGTRISAAAAVETSLATHYVTADRLPALERALDASGGEDVTGVLDRFASPPPPSELCGHYAAIERCFSAPTLDEVFERLAAERSDWAAETLDGLRRVSPAGLVLTFELLRRGASTTLAECLDRDLRLACRVARSHDFQEGVRAALVDKDRNPSWRPAALAELAEPDRAELHTWLD
ncbi:enoyl-CoA hydratase/isomerase family protein [Streptomyces sp. RB6PN25]|uniref:3-hydroxyisobutyryl-CoA hydrolase n=1 Tax=Streptomyces humicola TaxID=2953240 RepID=A0ABT1PQR3_9ACTN|nr:enoyl-CoA hydratase/isomerase family protein [Streptomyces humicola]MCQ4080010.1 enoyl-CoA hydratase/isomerase family protein [Streptomyces humicola]